MSEYLVSPDLTLELGGKSYLLAGNFRTFKALQQAFKLDLLYIQAFVLDMRLDEIALFVAASISASNPSATSPTDEEIGDAIMDVIDVASPEYRAFKAKLLAWLNLSMTPKAGREKKARELEAMLKSLSAPSPSRGKRTKASA